VLFRSRNLPNGVNQNVAQNVDGFAVALNFKHLRRAWLDDQR